MTILAGDIVRRFLLFITSVGEPIASLFFVSASDSSPSLALSVTF